MANVAELYENQLSAQVNYLRTHGIPDEQIASDLNQGIRVIRSVPLPRPQPQRQRAAQAMQLQVIVQQLMPLVEAGDQAAIALLLKVQRREADLLGLDAPKEVVTHNFNQDTADLKAMTVSQLKALVLQHLEATTLDVTPSSAGEDAEADPPAAPVGRP